MSARRHLPARLLVVLVALLAGCGSGQTDSARVHSVVEDFGKASAAHDYQQICDQLLAPALVDKVQRIGLPCELAFKRGLGSVSKPRITIGAIRVTGATASARVHSTAAGQPPSDDTLRLVRVGKTWRIAALSSAPPAPHANAAPKP